MRDADSFEALAGGGGGGGAGIDMAGGAGFVPFAAAVGPFIGGGGGGGGIPPCMGGFGIPLCMGGFGIPAGG